MNSEKKSLYIVAGFALILTFTLLWMFVSTGSAVFLVIGILMLMTAYQIIMRLVVGVICEALAEKGISYRSAFFGVSEAERRFYAAAKMRRFKRGLPVFGEFESLFLSKRSAEDILAESCRIELCHVITFFAGFLPLVLSVYFGQFWIFLAGSVIAAVYDLICTAVQRYNRPRLIEVSDRQRERFFRNLDRNDREENAPCGEYAPGEEEAPDKEDVPESNSAEQTYEEKDADNANNGEIT